MPVPHRYPGPGVVLARQHRRPDADPPGQGRYAGLDPVADLAEDAEERANAAAVREQTKLHNDRFITAAAQLGHDSPAIQPAGAHALAGLADDAPTADPTSNLHGRVSFRSARFTGGTVNFWGARFSSSRVDFDAVAGDRRISVPFLFTTGDATCSSGAHPC
ncbi:MAG TPA: hypothetical protein VNW94_29145 [Streptosporangiaceae bacterium]|nr:hypothetical protein [Streptosporangiaceae bacterium]